MFAFLFLLPCSDVFIALFCLFSCGLWSGPFLGRFGHLPNATSQPGSLWPLFTERFFLACFSSVVSPYLHS